MAVAVVSAANAAMAVVVAAAAASTEPRMGRWDAVIFDCDGVLVDTETIAERAAAAALSRLGLHYDQSEARARFMGLSVRDWEQALNADSMARLGRPLPDGVIAALSAEITRRVLADIRPIPGGVGAVRAHVGPKAVASSSPRSELVGKIAGLGLAADFGAHVYSGDDVARAKPAPALFLHAAARLGVVPGSCLVIEDSLHGVTAGVAAGMTVWGFVGGPHCGPDQAERLRQAGAARVFADMVAIADAVARR